MTDSSVTRAPFVARSAASLAVLLGPVTMAAWWVWALFDSELAVFAGLTSLIALQLLGLCATFVARSSSRTWRRPRKLWWLLPYWTVVGATALFLLWEFGPIRGWPF